ncbi:MAG: hypothetical protein RBG13Loki_1325 [Promethearchaeota archaeon CR_4]|nr:MAG: hypothetical protein RBG13Loki_1325 [Candidatus Lokiarchaeota archaeon CR_4]
MLTPERPQEKSQIANVLEHSIELFQSTGMSELASKWERILKTYKTQKDKSAL